MELTTQRAIQNINIFEHHWNIQTNKIKLMHIACRIAQPITVNTLISYTNRGNILGFHFTNRFHIIHHTKNPASSHNTHHSQTLLMLYSTNQTQTLQNICQTHSRIHSCPAGCNIKLTKTQNAIRTE